MRNGICKTPIRDLLDFILEHIKFTVTYNKRSLSYANNMPIIEQFKALGIWEHSHKDESKRYFLQISNKWINLYNWHDNLKKNPDWLPDYSRNINTSRVFTPDQFLHLKKINEKIVESRNIAIKNKIMATVTNYFYKSLEEELIHWSLNWNDHQHLQILRLMGWCCIFECL